MNQVKMNPSCPILPWYSQEDARQQAMWCPIAQAQNYNLQEVFTGGNDPRVNKMMGIEFYTSWPTNYRQVPQLTDNLAGPICMSGNCGPLLPPKNGHHKNDHHESFVHMNGHHMNGNGNAKLMNGHHMNGNHMNGNHQENFIHMNGNHMNGHHMNGNHMNGNHMNGNAKHMNGDHMNGDHMNGNAKHMNGHHMNGHHMNNGLNDKKKL